VRQGFYRCGRRRLSAKNLEQQILEHLAREAHGEQEGRRRSHGRGGQPGRRCEVMRMITEEDVRAFLGLRGEPQVLRGAVTFIGERGAYFCGTETAWFGMPVAYPVDHGN